MYRLFFQFIIMKKVFIVIAVLCIGMFCRGQILKDISRRIANDAESKTEQKISSKVDQGLDSLFTKKSKKGKKKNSSTTVDSSDSVAAAEVKQPENNNTSGTNDASGINSTITSNNDQSNDSSYIKLNLSANKILAGGTVIISGSSIMYGSLNKVALTINGPSGNESKDIALKPDGSFSTDWQSGGAGEYTITVKSSDGKGHASASLTAFKFTEMDNIIDPPVTQTEKAYDNLVKWINIVKTKVIKKDADDLQKKTDGITEKKDEAIKFFNDLDNAGKGLDDIEKKYGSIPSSVSKNLSQLTDVLSDETTRMESLNTIVDHQASDNSICEYLVMANEACAAFTTIFDFYGKCSSALIKLTAGSGDPAGKAEGANTGAESDNPGSLAIHEVAKLFLTSKIDVLFTEEELKGDDVEMDISEFLLDNLLKKYCVVMSGDLKHDYQCTFKNEYNNVWWQYKYSTEATISLRYPRNNTGGRIIKMKGNIEGNATKFSIYQKASEIDEFREAMKGRAQLYSVLLYAPPSMPFSSSKADKNVGFGAIARAVVTPAYFNIPIDADYDVEAKKLKIYVNTALVDFNPSLVRYIYCYITFPLGIPLTTRIDYPINSVKLTLGKVIEKNNDFNIHADAENNLSVSAKGSTTVGMGTSIVHLINFSFSMKSE